MARILLLEDNLLLRDMLAETLEKAGHTVQQGDDGQSAYDPELVASFDLMITDLFMPGVDGVDAILQARKAKPDLKIIAISGGGDYLTHDFLPHTREFGARAILRKPFRMAEFCDTVHKVLSVPEPLGAGNIDHALES